MKAVIVYVFVHTFFVQRKRRIRSLFGIVTECKWNSYWRGDWKLWPIASTHTSKHSHKGQLKFQNKPHTHTHTNNATNEATYTHTTAQNASRIWANNWKSNLTRRALPHTKRHICETKRRVVWWPALFRRRFLLFDCFSLCAFSCRTDFCLRGFRKRCWLFRRTIVYLWVWMFLFKVSLTMQINNWRTFLGQFYSWQ